MLSEDLAHGRLGRTTSGSRGTRRRIVSLQDAAFDAEMSAATRRRAPERLLALLAELFAVDVVVAAIGTDDHSDSCAGRP